MSGRFVGVLAAIAQLAPATRHCSLLPGWRLANLDPIQYTTVPVGNSISNETLLPSANNVKEKIHTISLLPEDMCDMARKKIKGHRKRIWKAHRDSYSFRTENCWTPEEFSWYKIPYNSTGTEPKFVAMKDGALFEAENGAELFRVGRKRLAGSGFLHEVSTSCPNWRDICGSDSPPDLPRQYKECALPYNYRWLRATDPRKRSSGWFAAPNGGGICRSRTQLEAGALMELFPDEVDLRFPQNPSVVTSTDAADKKDQHPSVPSLDYTFHTPRQLCGAITAWEVSHLEPPPCREPKHRVFKRIGYKDPRWVAASKSHEGVMDPVGNECTRPNAKPMKPGRKAQLRKQALASYTKRRARMRKARRNQISAQLKSTNTASGDPRKPETETDVRMPPHKGNDGSVRPTNSQPAARDPFNEITMLNPAVAGEKFETDEEEEETPDRMVELFDSKEKLDEIIRNRRINNTRTSPDARARSGFDLLNGETVRTQAAPPLRPKLETRDIGSAAPAQENPDATTGQTRAEPRESLRTTTA